MFCDFQTEADRAMYSKKRKKSDEDVTDEFHCPVSSCYFNITSPRSFSSFKNLKSVSNSGLGLGLQHQSTRVSV